jgi:hypothetical protein
MPTTARARGTRRLAIASASALGLAVALAGCGGSSGSTASGASALPEGYTAERVPGPAGAPADGTTDAGDRSAAGPLAVVRDRSIVIVSDVLVRVDDIRSATTDLAAIAVRHRATVASQTTSTGPTAVDAPLTKESDCPPSGCPTSYASSTTTLRLGNDAVDALLRDIGALGVLVSSTLTSDDVTAEVADVDARLRNAEASLARVRALMSRATTIGDVVALEAELSRRQGDLEALEARQRTLADQSAQATVTVRLVDEGAPVVADTGTGFVAGLRAGWGAFTVAAVAGLTVLGALVPFLAVGGAVALLAWWLVRRRRPSTGPVVPDPVGARTG